jgi:hypothetical protein
MDLKDFVTKTVLQILDGVREAASTVDQEAGMRVNPHYKGQPPQKASTPIDFDVAVTVRETDGSAGGGRISVMGLGVGGEITSEVGTESVTRVRFKVPVQLPGNHVDESVAHRPSTAEM